MNVNRLIPILLLFYSSFVWAQPADGTYGNASFNGRAHGWFRATGWSIGDPNSHILVWFNGDGSNTGSFTTYANESPATILNAGDWNGITTLPGGGEAKWLIFILGNSGTTTIPETDISYFFQTLLGNAFDTANGKKRLHIGGFSGGPGRMWGYLRNALGGASPYRSLFSTTITISCASIFDDLTAVAVGKKHYVWYGDPAGDGNSGTPPSTSLFVYNNGLAAITANVDKRFKYTIGGGHGNSTVGVWNNPLTCLGVTGTDSASNRWIWMATAFGNAGENVAPVANAGTDQLIVLPTTTATLNGSGSSDIDGTISSYAWTKISGPSGGTISSPTSVSTNITSMQEGVYKYRLLVTDNSGATDDDTVQISVVDGVPSSSRIIIDLGNHFWPWTGREQPELLFDGLSDKKMDQNGNTNFASPMKFAIELKDSVYENVKIVFDNGANITQTWTVTLYDSNRVLRGTYTMSNGSTAGTIQANVKTTLIGNPDTIQEPVKWVMFECSNAASDIREIEVYGDRAAKVTTLAPKTVIPTVLADPGIKHTGGSSLGGADSLYQKLSNGRLLYNSFRSPSSLFTWMARDGVAFNAQPLTLNRFGDHGGWTLQFYKNHRDNRGGDVMFYHNGSSMGAGRSTTLGLDYNSSYTAMGVLNQYKDVLPGTDSTNVSSWVNTTRAWRMLTHVWGGNTASVLPGDHVIESSAGVDVSAGQNKYQVAETENEPDKDWYGANGYHSPDALLAKLIAAHAGIKAADPNMKVNVGALLGADTLRWKSMFFIYRWKYSWTGEFPADGLNFNQYISSAYGGQPHSGFEDAVSPEQFQVKERMQKYVEFRNRFFPGREFRWTEIGFASSTSGSDYSVKGDLPGLPDSVVQGMLMIRVLERGMCVPNGLTAIYNYWHNSDGSGTFGTMIQIRPKFHPVTSSYIGSDRLPIWFMYATRVNSLYDYKGWSTLIIDGDSTSTNVYRRDHLTDPTKKVYTIYQGTYSGSTVNNYALNIGSTATSATLITYAFGDEDGVQTSLPITSGNITIPVVNEVPQYIQVNYGGPTNRIFKKAGTRWNVTSIP